MYGISPKLMQHCSNDGKWYLYSLINQLFRIDASRTCKFLEDIYILGSLKTRAFQECTNLWCTQLKLLVNVALLRKDIVKVILEMASYQDLIARVCPKFWTQKRNCANE